MFNNCKLAIIGCGNWGINHVRTAYDLLKSNLKLACDVNTNAFSRVKSISESIPFTTNLQDVLNNKVINCVIIATPPSTHYEIAKQCLQHGKHVLVEKPITLVADHARDLVRIALANERTLMVGHVLLYHPAIIKLKQEIDRDRIGKILYIYSNRLNLGTIRSEENILWSFAPHDVSIIQYLTESYPIYIDAKGANFLQNNIEDTTLTYLVYPNNIHAHIFVSWLHPFKEHRLLVIGTRGMMVFEDNKDTDKLKFYPNGFQDSNGHYEKFEGECEVVSCNDDQPLSNEQKHFFNAILGRTKALSDGQHALEVLDILAKAQSKLKKYDYEPPFTKNRTPNSAEFMPIYHRAARKNTDIKF